MCTAYASKGRPNDSTEAVQEVKKVMELVEASSAQTAVVLKAVLELLQRVDPEATRMTPQNLGVVFGPTLICREDPQASVKHCKVCSSAAQTLSDAVVTDPSQSCPPFWGQLDEEAEPYCVLCATIAYRMMPCLWS